jgi:hypothetical protein
VHFEVTPLLHGATYLYPFYFWVPRAFWAAKPDAIGHAYVRWIEPELATTGHSIAISYLGEGAVNFGSAGILVGALLAVGLIALLRRLNDVVARPGLRTRASIFLLCGGVILQTSMLDFVWADSNTYTHRGLVRLAVVFAYATVALAVGWLARRQKS